MAAGRHGEQTVSEKASRFRQEQTDAETLQSSKSAVVDGSDSELSKQLQHNPAKVVTGAETVSPLDLYPDQVNRQEYYTQYGCYIGVCQWTGPSFLTNISVGFKKFLTPICQYVHNTVTAHTHIPMHTNKQTHVKHFSASRIPFVQR